MTTVKQKKTTASWSDVKKQLADCDQAALLKLVQDLYAASKDNQAFLHTRFGLGDDLLKPYKASLALWLWPTWKKPTSVAKAKKAIADYKKASGQPEGLSELMVYYCEQGAGFSIEVGLQDEGYFDALVRMFEQALKAIANLPEAQRPTLLQRLAAVRRTSHNIGYGVGDAMGDLLAGLDIKG